MNILTMIAFICFMIFLTDQIHKKMFKKLAPLIINSDVIHSGRTTWAIMAAPKNAIYVCNYDSMRFMQRLAKELGRTDLRVTYPMHTFRLDIVMVMKGINSAIIVDHYIKETSKLLGVEGWNN